MVGKWLNTSKCCHCHQSNIIYIIYIVVACTHVAAIMFRKSKNSFYATVKAAMTEEHKKQLRESLDRLQQNMNAAPVLTKLISKMILTPDEEVDISYDCPNYRIVNNLINALLMKSDRAFYALLESLEESEQDHIAEIIKQAGTCRL